ncbi:MAG: sulfite exporter TauE/SafE family protein, partial [Candidatus Sulfotelmatobacter sp.]
LGFGIQFLFFPKDLSLAKAAADNPEGLRPSYWRVRLITVSALVGLISGLLANSGGFLLVPCYTEFLRQPMKKAFACSLAVSSVLAAPGTIVHAYLGHISWLVAGLVALGAMPFSHLGARLAIHTRAVKLERWYGLALTGLGIFFLFQV